MYKVRWSPLNELIPSLKINAFNFSHSGLFGSSAEEKLGYDDNAEVVLFIANFSVCF